MQGLLMKDILLLKNQGKSLIIVLLIGLFMMYTMDNIMPISFYITFVAVNFAISTISYDQFENSLGYIFALAITRRNYVNEKYIFGLISCVIGWGVSMALAITSMAAKNQPVESGEFIFTELMNLGIGLLVLSICIPIRIKYGAEKGRIIYFIVLGLIIGIPAAIVGLGVIAGLKIGQILQVSQYVQYILEGCGVILVLGSIICSYLITLRIVKKQEF